MAPGDAVDVLLSVTYLVAERIMPPVPDFAWSALADGPWAPYVTGAEYFTFVDRRVAYGEDARRLRQAIFDFDATNTGFLTSPDHELVDALAALVGSPSDDTRDLI